MRVPTLLEALLFTAAIVFTAVPAKAQDARLAQATAERNAGHADAALALFEELHREHPRDADLLRQLAGVYAAAGKFVEARATIEQARALAPADRDIMLEEARIALWSGHQSEARRIEQRIAAADPKNPELPELHRSIVAASDDARSFGVTVSDGSFGTRIGPKHRTWNEAHFELDAPISPRARLSGEIVRFDREVAVDTELAARVDDRLGQGTFAYLLGSVTPGADFRSHWSIGGGLETAVARSMSLTLDARRFDYGSTSATTLNPGFRLSAPNNRAALAFQWINSWTGGRRQSGGSVQLSLHPSDQVTLLGGAADYPDTEAGITRRVRSYFGGVDLRVARALSVRLVASSDRRENSYRSRGAMLSLRWRLPR